MNAERIKQRLAELENQKRQLHANLHAVDGAMQDCEYWLNEIEKERKPNGDLSPASKTRDEGCD